jgi:hypothetical protein
MDLDRKRVLRALTLVRAAILRSTTGDVPHLSREAAAEQLRPRTAALALSSASGQITVRVLPDEVTEHVKRLLRTRGTRDLITVPKLQGHAAVIYRSRLYRLEHPVEGAARFGQIEAFWSYLQRQLRARGGIRRERLELHLAEFAWRYNHRARSPRELVRQLLHLLRHGGRNGTLAWSDRRAQPWSLD